MTPDDARAILLEFIRETAAAAGFDWTKVEVAGAEDCTLPSGATGAQYPISATGPGAENVEEVIQNVRSFWKSRGYDLPIEHVEFGALQITYPLDDDSFTLQFGVNENASDMSTYSRCAPGDSYALNVARQRTESAPPPTPPTPPPPPAPPNE